MDHPQQLVQCPHCVSKVKGNRLSLHINKVHRNVQGKQQCVLNADHKVDDMHLHLEEDCCAMAELKKNAYDSGGVSTVPPLTKCNIDFGSNPENWDDSNYPAYEPLVATGEKNIIRGFYVAGLKPAERKNAILEERNRREQLSEKQQKKYNQISYSNQNQFHPSTFPTLTESRSNNRAPSYNNQFENRQPGPVYVGNSYKANAGNYARAPGGSTNINDFCTIPEPRQSGTESNNVTTDSDGYTVVKRAKGVGRGRGRGQK